MKKSILKKLLVVAAIITCIGIFYYFHLDKMISIKQITASKDNLRMFIAHHFCQAACIFIGIYAMLITLSLPGGVILSLAGGYLFGAAAGGTLNLIGATIGAAGAFLVVRYLIGNAIQQQFTEQLNAFNEELNNYGVLYLIIVRLIPLFPFFLVNLLAGLTNLPFGWYTLATIIGIAPGAYAFAYAGRQLDHIDSVADIVSLRLIITFFILALFFFIPLLVKKNKIVTPDDNQQDKAL